MFGGGREGTLACQQHWRFTLGNVVLVQDARILGEMQQMRQIYSNLYDLNRDLLLEHTKRTTNHA
eukprot:COSAG05_NODE_6636_length_927_cov_1.271739_1_plen_64_part_10